MSRVLYALSAPADTAVFATLDRSKTARVGLPCHYLLRGTVKALLQLSQALLRAGKSSFLWYFLDIAFSWPGTGAVPG